MLIIWARFWNKTNITIYLIVITTANDHSNYQLVAGQVGLFQYSWGSIDMYIISWSFDIQIM